MGLDALIGVCATVPEVGRIVSAAHATVHTAVTRELLTYLWLWFTLVGCHSHQSSLSPQM